MSEIFNANRHNIDGSVLETDATDGYANLQLMFVSFYHLPTNQAVYFKAILTGFDENYQSEWSSEQVYGRPDPIYIYKSTKRNINFNLVLPSSTTGEAIENFAKIQKMIQFMYPSYENPGYAQTITQSPLVRFKAFNIITNNQHSPVSIGPNSLSISKDPKIGLLGFLTNVNMDPQAAESDIGVIAGENVIIPKTIKSNISFTPIHENPLGWSSDGFSTSQNRNFPYNIPQFYDGAVAYGPDTTDEASWDSWNPDIDLDEYRDAGIPEWASATEEGAKAAIEEAKSRTAGDSPTPPDWVDGPWAKAAVEPGYEDAVEDYLP